MILYLDFDGVLHPDDVYLDHRNRPTLRGFGELFQYAGRLEQILAPYPAVQIVLSTSWVRIKGFDRSCRRLPPGLRQRVIGATWHSHMKRDREASDVWINDTPRYEQILHDVRRRRLAEWTALDDDDLGWPPAAKRHLIACDPTLGLSEPRVQLALKHRLLTGKAV